ncbi:MAG TPA: DUF2094 domain-containing protein [Candidatus Desulfofervidus auxilii]|uniref:DUF2094 domain-containing protein n=1 Tax=Desulfofervidus auxilii TaxID=1621989 RepID=A0A7C0U4K3_DESA2|nr:DUF2094 domain-containing protein [Candidatus Desulfofervidus auxilii]
MLGLNKKQKNWLWVIGGKHPAAPDYIFIGNEVAPIKAIFNWIEKGYQALLSKHSLIKTSKIWRFWIYIPKNVFFCGILRESMDSNGRSYPFAVVGKGSLLNWQNQWPLLPFAFNETWEKMELLFSQNISSIKILQNNLNWIIPPKSYWEKYQVEIKKAWEKYSSLTLGNNLAEIKKIFEAGFKNYTCHNYCFIPFNPICPVWVPTSLGYAILYSWGLSMPLASFIGGDIQHSGFFLFNRTLNKDDFIMLWLTKNDKKDNNEIEELSLIEVYKKLRAKNGVRNIR